MKIAIFGGAFDPPHLGHINLVKSVRDSIKPDKTLIIPTGNAPHKSTMTPFEVRFKLAQAAFPYCGISDIENKPQTSYTVDTLKKLREIYPTAQLHLIIGSDMLVNFDKWKDYKHILELCTVVASARDSSEYAEYAKNFGIKFIDIRIIEMSSTQIRSRLSEKRYNHSINVAIMCGELSRKINLDSETAEKSYLAGILHDITKKSEDIPDSDRFSPDPLELATPKLWHALTGAKYVQDELGITDKDIINAIRFHTIARANMSVVEKIVYISDKISTERTYNGVKELRQLAFENLDLSIHTAIKRSIKKLMKNGVKIPKYTFDAYNYYS